MMKSVCFEMNGQVETLGQLPTFVALSNRVNAAVAFETWWEADLANVDASPDAEADIGLLGPTRVTTPNGPVRIDELKTGQLVIDHLGNTTKVRSVSISAPTKHAVILRAPYFGLDHDLTLGNNHRILMQSEMAEALFGEESVLMPAWALKDGKRVKFTELTKRERLYEVKLESGNALRVGNCAVASKPRIGASPIALPLSDSEARCFSTSYRNGFHNSY